MNVVVHTDNTISGHEPDDIRCVMEALIDGQSPAVATQHADTVDEAVRGAAHRPERVIESQLGRVSNDTVRRHA